jgi:hypothetical protein
MVGNDLEVIGHKIDVFDNVTISTRVINPDADADPSTSPSHLNDPSIGDSGDIDFTAQYITIHDGASLLTHVEDGSTYQGGDIFLSGSDTTGVFLPLVQINNSDTTVTVDGATIKGDDVRITAEARSVKFFDDFAGPIEMALTTFESFVSPAGVAISNANAVVTIGDGADIDANELWLKSSAFAEAKFTATDTAIAVSYGESNPIAKVIVESGADIHTTGNTIIRTFADSELDIAAKMGMLGPARSSSPLSVTVAIADSTIKAISQISSGANITVGGTLEVTAKADKNHNVKAAAGAYADGTLGVGVAVANSTSTVEASVGGTISVENDIIISADSNTPKNDTAADAAVGSGFVAQKIIKAKDGLGDKVSGFLGNNTPTTKPSAGSTQPLALAGAFSFATHTNNVTAKIGDGATVKSETGGIDVTSNILDVVETSAISTIDSNDEDQKQNSISVAVVVGNFHNNATAFIGNGAVVNAPDVVLVEAETKMPYEIQWLQLTGLSDITDKLNSNFGIQNGFFTSWAQSNAQGTVTGIAGSVNVLNITNTTLAYIDENAQVNQDAAFRFGNQDVIITAKNQVETVNLSGVFGIKFFGTQGGKGGVGGAYLDVSYANTAQAMIKNGAMVYGDTLTVWADTMTRNISIAESGGKADTFALNGSFSLLDTDNKTIAQIDDGASVTTGTGNISVARRFDKLFGDDNFLIDALPDVDSSEDVDYDDNTIDFGISGVTSFLKTGDEVLYSSGDYDPIGGLSDGETYYVIWVNPTTIKLALTEQAAEDGNTIDLTAPEHDSDVHSFTPDRDLLDDIEIEQKLATLDSNGDGEITDADRHVTSTDDDFYYTGLNQFVLAEDESQIWNFAGGIAKSKNVGIGASISINEINRNTEALIGNREGESDDDGSLSAGGDMMVSAMNDGIIGSFSLAAAVILPGDAPDDNQTQENPDGKGSFGIGISGDVSINTITDKAQAYIKDANITDAGDIDVVAKNDSDIIAGAGSISISKPGETGHSVGIAGSYTQNTVTGFTKAPP